MSPGQSVCIELLEGPPLGGPSLSLDPGGQTRTGISRGTVGALPPELCVEDNMACRSGSEFDEARTGVSSLGWASVASCTPTGGQVGGPGAFTHEPVEMLDCKT